jgi:uncharacterized membrane protein YtjA (UPF0391 family)
MNMMLSSGRTGLGGLSSVAIGSAKVTFFFFFSSFVAFTFQTMLGAWGAPFATLLLFGGGSLHPRHLLELMQSSGPSPQHEFLA